MWNRASVLFSGSYVTSNKKQAIVLRYFAGWADKLHGDTIPTDGEVTFLIRIERNTSWTR